jgi:hypothetical protein
LIRCTIFGPARAVDRFQTGLHFLDGLVSGQGAEPAQGLLLVNEPPELFSAMPGERVLDLHRAPQPDHILGTVGALHAPPPRTLGPLRLKSYYLFASIHADLPPARIPCKNRETIVADGYSTTN